MKNTLNSPIHFNCGATMKNKFMLAPLTNSQSHENGQLSDDELHWLTMRAKGQFGLVMTCASHVQEIGKGFKGQLGIYNDEQIPGHQKLTKNIQNEGCLAVIQLHHAGMRSPKEIIGETPVCPSINEKTGARALSLTEIEQLKNDFISAAKRAQKSGYDGAEIHGAHGYILTQFLSSEINFRTDEYGGDLENRSRLLFEIVDGIRKACGPNFLVGVRLSPERYGMDLNEVKILYKRLIDEGKVDFLDVSLWDCFKYPEEEQHQNKTLLAHFTEIDRKNVKLTVAGKIRTAQNVKDIIDANVDFVGIGHSAILHHDFPVKVMENSNFKPTALPVSKTYLSNEGVSDKFINYMRKWPSFVKKEQ